MIKTSSNAVLLQPDQIKKHDRGGGASTTPLVTKGVGATGFITGYTEFAGGAEIAWHQHNCEESVVLIEGNAIFDIGDEHIPVRTQDTTFIPPNVPHRFRNASATEPMKILWIYASVDATRTLVETGEERPVAAEHAPH
ncbi:MAG: cupin domain-containing protein [Ottowia sp.]|uniref:cupin domain-containing protein n=1 Tax=Ottowia sp. TaxID=1898956 RepID=UPI003C759FF3